MNEYLEGLQGTVGLLIPLAASAIWWVGGRPNGRVYRRWVFPLFFSLALICLSVWMNTFRWWFLLSIPAYKAISHVGYGADTFAGKLARRGLWSLLMTACALTFCLWTHAWTVFMVQAFVGFGVAVTFGSLNPVKAAQEEGVICFGSTFLVPYALF